MVQDNPAPDLLSEGVSNRGRFPLLFVETPSASCEQATTYSPVVACGVINGLERPRWTHPQRHRYKPGIVIPGKNAMRRIFFLSRVNEYFALDANDLYSVLSR